ncbi:ATP phosphoribosyltransferase regulatory subunit [Amaricoccus tamworthensis]|uniref:ATP phosphoribosyltransferase regulatory subunit n=1 Tax=Amaricoccus tamworthensis TaxID=57002 RepID=UPI003C7BE3C2
MVTDRAYLKGARMGAGLSQLDAEISSVLGVLMSSGADRVEPEVLQPADVLLDLYGEDIRARAFVTRDDRAEMMLRPDFTVPLVRLHAAAELEEARYAYCGPVWRRQEFGSERPREYLQAGFELFGASDQATADAEVLSLIMEAVGDAGVRFVTGDMGLAISAIDALDTSDARKAALRRHLWRPQRFQSLLRRYGVDHALHVEKRRELVEVLNSGGLDAAIRDAGKPVGLRSADEVARRVRALADECEIAPLDPGAVSFLEAVLAVKGSSTEALARLRDLQDGQAGFTRAVDRLEARLAAFEARGIDPEGLAFEGSFGRTTLEYYDGFVFGAEAVDAPDLPAVASGGRYDALTRTLSQGEGMTAVGGMIRVEALAALRRAGA